MEADDSQMEIKVEVIKKKKMVFTFQLVIIDGQDIPVCSKQLTFNCKWLVSIVQVKINLTKGQVNNFLLHISTLSQFHGYFQFD